MSAYRVKRRAFLAALGGAAGLQALLGGLEASAEGLAPPPRLLVMHWPLGTLRQRFLPTPTGVGDGFVSSPLLEPFEKAGLHDDMIVLYGLRHNFKAFGGGNEAGTVFAVTGADVPGTRQNGGETDDSVAGGPSFDQIFSKYVPALKNANGAPVNAIADARVFSYETSTQCLSYSYDTREISAAQGGLGGKVTEHVPLLPETQPLALYNRLFSGLAPGGDGDAAHKALLLRKSVLDYALTELKRLRDLAPGSERHKLDMHAEAIRKLELQLQEQLDGSPVECALPPAPDAALVAKTGSKQIITGPVDTEDASHVAKVGKQHAAIIRTAFQCDLARVATLQWCPGTNHVAFSGMNPNDPDAIYEMGSFHYAVSDSQFYSGSPPAPGASNAYVYETMFGMYHWFNQQTAEVLSELKATQDIFGANLLDSTIVPYLTEQAQSTDERQPLPAVIFGGRALGMQGGKLKNFTTPYRSHNDLWMTIAQALMKTADPVSVLAAEKFMKSGVTPIEGLWKMPA